MRSSGRTIVSRTIDRIASERRSRRGRCVIAPRVVVMSFAVAESRVRVVIVVSVKESARALVRAEAAPEGAIGAVGAKPSIADRATLEMRKLLGVPAPDANPFAGLRHFEISPIEPCLSIVR